MVIINCVWIQMWIPALYSRIRTRMVQLSSALRKASCRAGLSQKWPDVCLAVRAGADSGFCPSTLHIRPRGNLLALILQSSSGLLTAGRIPTQCSDLEKTNFLITWGFGAIDRV